MIGHLGARVSALLDGQLPPEEEEACWAHVYACHACRDLVEREGWVKTQLAGLSGCAGAAPADLKGSLLQMPPGDRYLAEARASGPRHRRVGAAVLGGGAIGAAMLGVVALGLAPGGSSPADRRPPPSRVDVPAASVTSTPSATPVRTGSGIPAGADAVPSWVRRLVP